MAGTKEEKKHQVYKSGAKSANPVDTEKQLVKRDAIISTLRYLQHGGGVGRDDRFIFSKEFSTFGHPKNLKAPYPILENLTSYLGGTLFGVYARKFYYVKGSKVTKTLPENELKDISVLLDRKVPSTVTPSKQFVVDGKPFAVGDNVSVVSPNEDEKRFLSACLFFGLFCSLVSNFLFFISAGSCRSVTSYQPWRPSQRSFFVGSGLRNLETTKS